MDRFEYRSLTFGGVLKTAKSDDIEAQLNELGQEGWEAVGISNDSSGRLQVLLMRRHGDKAAGRSKDSWGKW